MGHELRTISNNNRGHNAINPSSLSEKGRGPPNSHDGAPLLEVVHVGPGLPTINVGNWDINGPSTATLVSLSDKQMLF
jgi:hypothetical protein